MCIRDSDAIMAADFVLDIGPGAGIHGGEIIAKGTPLEITQSNNSLTGKYLSGEKKIEVPKHRQKPNNKIFKIINATGNNLKGINFNVPVGLFNCVTGVSGSGKSTLVNNTLYHAIAKYLYRSNLDAAPHDSMEGLDFFDKVVDVNQSPIGRTPRSNPATYTGLFTPIRDLFAKVPESRARGYSPGRFSFNVKGGRCETCEGDGVIKVEMHFLPDVYVKCDTCSGQRYNRETLDIKYKGKNILSLIHI